MCCQKSNVNITSKNVNKLGNTRSLIKFIKYFVKMIKANGTPNLRFHFFGLHNLHRKIACDKIGMM